MLRRLRRLRQHLRRQLVTLREKREDITKFYLDDVVDMSLPVVSQLDAEQHQTEPRLQELLVGGRQVVSQALGLKVGEDAAGPSVSEERAEVTPGGGAVVALVVSQGEGQVEVVALQSTNIIHHLQLHHRDVIYNSPLSLSVHYMTYYCLGFASTLQLDFFGLKENYEAVKQRRP